MRGYAIALVLFAVGCNEDVNYGEVQVIDTGSERVELRACLDGELFDCNGETIVLIAEHGGQSSEMKFSGIFFPEHHAYLDLADRTEPFVVRQDDQAAELVLPPAFELSGQPAEPLGPHDRLALTWQGANMGMRWDVEYACPDAATNSMKRGAVTNSTIEDDGSIELEMDAVVRALDADAVSLSECTIELQFSRVREGSVDDGFHAERSTAITRRTVDIAFVR
jgi:hypothetical protein